MAYALDVTFSFYQFLPILEPLPSKFLETTYFIFIKFQQISVEPNFNPFG